MNVINRMNRFNQWLSTWFERVAVLGLLAMLVATCIDVTGAKILKWPLPSGTEIVYLLQLVAIAGAIASTKIAGSHIRVEALVDKLPKRGRALLNSLTSLLGLGLFVLLAWESYEYTQSFRSANEVTSTAQIPLYPFTLWIALCCIPISLILITDLVTWLIEVIKK